MTINRVLVAPLNYSHRQRGQVEAFQRVFGAKNVLEFDWYGAHRQGRNASALLASVAAGFKPDWIWIQAQGGEGLEPVRVRQIRENLPGAFLTHWMGDCRAHVPELLAYMCQATHATLLSNAGQHAMYLRAGAARVHYVQIGLDPEDLPGGEGERFVPPFRVPEVVFIGNHYGHVDQFGEGTQLRLKAVRALRAAGIDVGVVGSGWPDDIPVAGQCHVKEQVGVYKRAKVALSINHFNRIPRYYSDRHLIAMASGTPVVAKYVPELEQEFTCEGQAQVGPCELYWWSEISELVDAVRYLLADPIGARAIGARGQARVLADHTWEKRIRDLLPHIEAWRREDCSV